uniref:Superoxide dismutase [Cu-Zn] n=1 Tax=Magallana gigas TaxID=29159 RepID=K1RAH2_MAGGI
MQPCDALSRASCRWYIPVIEPWCYSCTLWAGFHRILGRRIKEEVVSKIRTKPGFHPKPTSPVGFQTRANQRVEIFRHKEDNKGDSPHRARSRETTRAVDLIKNQGGFPPQGQAAGPTANIPGLGGFQPNAIGGFGTVGNRFGNPFVPGNVIGNNLPGANGGGNNQNQFTAGGQLFMSLSQNPNNYRYATCYFNSTENAIRGRADFRQFLFGDSGVDIRIQVVGLPTSPVDTQRGIHIHEFGDIGERCSRVGPHFNPTQTRHGGRNSYPFLRHVGDLGNMLQSAQGVASTQFRDEVISLQGQGSILGRSLVVKLERDDEGTGTNSASLQNGNARTPIACCTIGRASPANWRTPYSEDDLMVMSGGAWSPSTDNDCTFIYMCQYCIKQIQTLAKKYI